MKLINWLASKGMLNFMPDEIYLKLYYRSMIGERLKLTPPVTFNEKLQWLKLHDRRQEYSMMVDKYQVRSYIASKIGEEYLVPLIGVWDKPEDIDFISLPNQFVLKCTHNSGLGMCICKNKKEISTTNVVNGLKKGLSQNYYKLGREWPYKNVVPRIICEQYLTDKGKALEDYKIHCFNGVPRFILVCRGRFSDLGMSEDFFSSKWEHLDIKREGKPNSNVKIAKPECLEEMLKLASVLSKNIPFVRTDFYISNGRVLFGELTFYPASGLEKFIPKYVDKEIGEWLVLPAMGAYVREESDFV